MSHSPLSLYSSIDKYQLTYTSLHSKHVVCTRLHRSSKRIYVDCKKMNIPISGRIFPLNFISSARDVPEILVHRKSQVEMCRNLSTSKPLKCWLASVAENLGSILNTCFAVCCEVTETYRVFFFIIWAKVVFNLLSALQSSGLFST